MSSYHCSVKPVSRGAGRSSTAAAAYRAGVCLKDERTGEVHDYTRKQGVEHTELVFPSGVNMSREELWNSAEGAEKRKDARVAREFELALPTELTKEQRRELATGFVRHLVEQYGVAADVALHEPNRKGDQRNHHAHILITTRQISAQGLGNKTDLEQEDKALRAQGKDTGRRQIEILREEWAAQCNRALQRAGCHERVSHKSLAAQKIEREPTLHLGPVVTAMERRGIQTERGDLNREIKNQGQEHSADRRELESLQNQQSGIYAARQRLHIERAARAAEKEAAERREQEEKERALEQERKRHQKRVELEKQYGQSIRRLVLPQCPSFAHQYPEYEQYLNKLQVATSEQFSAMTKELQHAERRYEAQELFYEVAEMTSSDTSISGQKRVRDKFLADWDRAKPEQRTKMEQSAKEFVKTHQRQRSHRMGMSL